jgi:hypothetical protein
MTDSEREAFEQQLADDQSAREAVEQAVELHQAMSVVAAEPWSPSRSAWRLALRNPGAWGATAAACLLLALALWWLIRPGTPATDPIDTAREPSPAAAPDDTQASASLASAWTDIRHARMTDDSPFASTERIEASLAVEAGAASEEIGPSGTIPRWLLAAVYAETEDDQEKQ